MVEKVTLVYRTVELADGRKAMLDWLKEEDIPEVMEVLNDVIKEGRYLFMNREITDVGEELR